VQGGQVHGKSLLPLPGMVYSSFPLSPPSYRNPRLLPTYVEIIELLLKVFTHTKHPAF